MRLRASRWVLKAILVLAALSGCSGKVTRPIVELPGPETELAFAPLESDTIFYRVHLYWSGADKAGEVVRFRLALDADSTLPITRWHATTAKDTILQLSVDRVTNVRRHVIQVSAEDNAGRIDLTPATRSFYTRTIPPTSCITSGPSAFNPLIGRNFAFTTRGTDPDGGVIGNSVYVDSFEYLLLQPNFYGDPTHPDGHQPLPVYDQTTYVNLINQGTGDRLPPPYDDWKWVGFRGEKVRFENVGAAEYVIAIRAVDQAGAREQNLRFICNIRHFTVAPPTVPPPGPALTIFSSALLRPITLNKWVGDVTSPPIEMLEGETVSFSWHASAEAYGAVVKGYTYALDDLTAFPPFDLLRTGVTLAPDRLSIGYHFLYVRAIDDWGDVTNAVVPILVLRPAFRETGATRQVLYVDDSQSPGASQGRIGNYPSDVEETDWWLLRLLPQLGVPYTEWDTYVAGLDDVLGRKPPKLRDLANYSTVIWNVDFNNGVASPTALWRTLVEGPSSDLDRYLRGGGTLILTGFVLGSNTTSPRTTMYTYSAYGICSSLSPGSFEYRLSYFPRLMMGVDGMIPNYEGLRTVGARDFVAARPTAAGQALGFDTAFVDTGPNGSTAKWTTYSFGDSNTNWAPGLPQVDGWKMAGEFGCQELASTGFRVEDPSQPISDPIYRYHGVPVGLSLSGPPSPREGLVVGVRVQAHDFGLSGTGVVSRSDSRGAAGRMVHLGFPLYFLRDADAIRSLQAAFTYVNASPTLP